MKLDSDRFYFSRAAILQIIDAVSKSMQSVASSANYTLKPSSDIVIKCI